MLDHWLNLMRGGYCCATVQEMLDHSLNFMRGEIEGMWGRMAELQRPARRRLTFLINQRDAVLTIYAARGVAAEAAAAAMQARLDADVTAFVEEELSARSCPKQPYLYINPSQPSDGRTSLMRGWLPL